MEKPDEFEKAVAGAVKAIQSGNKFKITFSLIPIATLPTEELFRELCLWIEDVTVGRDIEALLAKADFPPEPDVRKLIKAVYDRDFTTLLQLPRKSEDIRPEDIKPEVIKRVIVEMLFAIAALEEAGKEDGGKRLFT